MDGQTDRQTDGQTDVGHINLIGGLVTRNPPNKMRNAVQIPKIFAKDVQLLTNMNISQGDCNFAISNFCHHFGIFAICLGILSKTVIRIFARCSKCSLFQTYYIEHRLLTWIHNYTLHY